MSAGLLCALAVVATGALARALARVPGRAGAPELARPRSAEAIRWLSRSRSVAWWTARQQDRSRRGAWASVADEIAATVRAGSSLPQALHSVAGQEGPASAVVRAVVEPVDRGRSLASAALAWADAATSPDERLLAEAVHLASGGRPDPLLFEAVAEAIRERRGLEGELRAQTAQARASAAVLALLPVAFTGLVASTDPDVVEFLLGTLPGRAVRGRWPPARGHRGLVDAPHHPERRTVTAAIAALTAAALVVAIGWRQRPLHRRRDDLRGAGVEATAAVLPRVSRRLDRRVGLAVATATAVVAGLLLLGPLATVTLGAGIAVWRVLHRRRSARRVAASRAASLPAALDLLVVGLAAGLTPRHGLRLVSERGPPLLRPLFGEVVGRMDAGEALAVALPRLVSALGEPARGLVRAIVVADRDGVPLRSLLGRLAEDARRARRHALESAIRRLPVRLAFPLVGCILPAFVVLTVVPVVGAGLHRLGSVGP